MNQFVPGAGGAKIFVRDFGGAGPTLLLIHGAGHSSENWRQAAPLLDPHFRVLAMDVRGHGRSDGPPDGPYDLRTLTADAIAVLDAFGVGRAHVMAQSMGGRIGYALSAWHPERVDRLVVIDMGADPSPGSLTTWQSLSQLVPASFPSREDAEAWMAQAGTGFLASNLQQSANGVWQFAINFPAMVAIAAQTSSQDLWGVVGQIRRPTLVVRGLRSPYISDETAARLRAHAPIQVAELDGGHALHMENPKELASLVVPFLSD